MRISLLRKQNNITVIHSAPRDVSPVLVQKFIPTIEGNPFEKGLPPTAAVPSVSCADISPPRGESPQTPFLKLLAPFFLQGVPLERENGAVLFVWGYPLQKKQSWKSLERGLGKNLSPERFAPVVGINFCTSTGFNVRARLLYYYNSIEMPREVIQRKRSTH